MFYIVGLFLILGLIIGGFSNSLPFNFGGFNLNAITAEAWDNFKDKTFKLLFPRSENEILIDNLNSNYNLLDRFFSESADTILNSIDIPETNKKEFKKTLETFNLTKEQIKILGAKTIKNEPGIIESAIRKVLGLESEDKNKNPSATYIPPSCQLVCKE